MVGYYVARRGIEAGELRAHLGGAADPGDGAEFLRAPEEDSVTLNGKVNVKALPGVEEIGRAAVEQGKGGRVVAATAVEEIVAGIWAEVLRLPQVGMEDNFFELGGHSLLATQVISRIRSAFGVEVPLQTLFESRTVAELAKAIEKARSLRRERSRRSLRSKYRNPLLPLSYGQQRLWFLDQLAPGNSATTFRTRCFPPAGGSGGAAAEPERDRAAA